jgi:predicted RNA-binding Zn-ribbon protein involved in translation (DUF1610 family)
MKPRTSKDGITYAKSARIKMGYILAMQRDGANPNQVIRKLVETEYNNTSFYCPNCQKEIDPGHVNELGQHSTIYNGCGSKVLIIKNK